MENTPSNQIVPYTSIQRNIETMRGAAGKALLVWIFSGSLGAALLAYVVFRGMGC